MWALQQLKRIRLVWQSEEQISERLRSLYQDYKTKDFWHSSEEIHLPSAGITDQQWRNNGVLWKLCRGRCWNLIKQIVKNDIDSAAAGRIKEEKHSQIQRMKQRWGMKGEWDCINVAKLIFYFYETALVPEQIQTTARSEKITHRLQVCLMDQRRVREILQGWVIWKLIPRFSSKPPQVAQSKQSRTHSCTSLRGWFDLICAKYDLI